MFKTIALFSLTATFAVTSMASDLSDAESQALCKKVLKHEKKDLLMGIYYTTEGRKYLNAPEDKTVINPVTKFPGLRKDYSALSIDGKCTGFITKLYEKRQEHWDTFQVYKHPLEEDTYLVFTVQMYGDTDYRRHHLYALDSNSCATTQLAPKTQRVNNGDYPSFFSYAVYDGQLYGIYQDHTLNYSEKLRQSVVLEEASFPNVINLTEDKVVTTHCGTTQKEINDTLKKFGIPVTNDG